MGGEILSISTLCFSMVLIGLLLGFLLLKIEE
ncbi:unnamed protein product [Discosporangium mesarthrocarpum]